MELSDFLDKYSDLREWACSYARRNKIMGDEYSWLTHCIYETSIERMSAGYAHLFCSGNAFTMQTGGSHEYFEFTIPISDIPADLLP